MTKLENIKLGLPDLASIKKDYSEIDERINAVSKKLESLRAMRARQNVRDISFNMSFAYEKVRLNKINLPLEMAIEHLDAWGREWQAEKQRWKNWQSSSLFKDRSYSQIRTTFENGPIHKKKVT